MRGCAARHAKAARVQGFDTHRPATYSAAMAPAHTALHRHAFRTDAWARARGPQCHHLSAHGLPAADL
ncbi:hypothetical protein GCM10023090_31060 [Acidovorax lacteus]|uniref:Uncharacterized protein n=1 Tax=Acidovorax lacteus TaxID=1924988 RepID=A0ABP8LJ79_9BURK